MLSFDSKRATSAESETYAKGFLASSKVTRVGRAGDLGMRRPGRNVIIVAQDD